jgi:hypothetical protein
MQETGTKRNTIDQFYTNPRIAKICVDLLKTHTDSNVWIEPSAGTGSFLQHVPDAVAYDIDPKYPGIIQQDFLTTDLPEECVIFGNPPFGRQSSMAKKFIRHACSKAAFVAFILPKSFMKPSMQVCFPLQYHLIDTFSIPPNSFILNGNAYDVPCIFQIWKRQNELRIVDTKTQPVGFQFVKKSELHNLVIRRVGVNAGMCSLPNDQSVQSHYFIKIDDLVDIDYIMQESKTWTIVENTVGPKSLSKSEICILLNPCISLANSRVV